MTIYIYTYIITHHSHHLKPATVKDVPYLVYKRGEQIGHQARQGSRLNFHLKKMILQQTLGTQLPHQQAAWLSFPWEMAKLFLTVESAAPWSLQNTIWPLSPQYLRGGDWKCSIRVFTSNHIVSSKLQGKTLGALCIIWRTVLASLACQWQMVVLRWGVEFVNTGIWNYVRYVIRLSRVGNAKKLLFQQTTVSLLHDTFLNHGLVRRSLICNQMSYIFYSIPAAAASGFEYSFRRPTRSSPKQESILRIWCFVKVMLADVVIRDGLPTEWKDQAVCILSDASGTLQSPLWISMFHLLTSIQSILPLKKLSKQINSIGTWKRSSWRQLFSTVGLSLWASIVEFSMPSFRCQFPTGKAYCYGIFSVLFDRASLGSQHEVFVSLKHAAVRLQRRIPTAVHWRSYPGCGERLPHHEVRWCTLWLVGFEVTQMKSGRCHSGQFCSRSEGLGRFPRVLGWRHFGSCSLGGGHYPQMFPNIVCHQSW